MPTWGRAPTAVPGRASVSVSAKRLPPRRAEARPSSSPQRRISSARSMPPRMIETSAFSRTAGFGW